MHVYLVNSLWEMALHGLLYMVSLLNSLLQPEYMRNVATTFHVVISLVLFL